jgi:histidinol-phosphate aminotransferase
MQLLREEIARLDEYTLKVHPCRIKLNQNENPYELPDEIKQEIVQRWACARWSRYPEFVPHEQIDKVAAFTGWKNNGVLLGNGSNDLLQLIIASVLERGKTAVITQPTFTLYKLLAKSFGANVCEVPMLKPFAFDVERIITTANQCGASLIILCSPNNPTGTRLTRDEVSRILASTKALVALDEAYVQFASENQIALLHEYERLVILQTFSKAMGAAGLRFGYSLASSLLTKQLNNVKLPYSVNIFTLMAAEVMMERWNTIRLWIDRILTERERVRRAMQILEGVRVYESSANFLLFETVDRSPKEIFSALLERGILIRDVSSYPMLERGLRVSIGTPEENNEFLSVLKEAL